MKLPYLSKLIIVLFSILITIACSNRLHDIEHNEFNPKLATELKRMGKIDQIASYIPQGKYKQLTKEQWNIFVDSIYSSHTLIIKDMFNKYGFIGYDLAGKEGSKNFWLMVQHADHDPKFQMNVLKQMKKHVKKQNASPTYYGLLTDRVRINTGKKQLYGTQVTYNMETGQAYPKPLKDSVNVNRRRKEIGLEPIEDYLNELTIMHLEMNKEKYEKLGITEPKLY